MLQGSGDTKAQATRLRREMSLPEVKLWLALRARPAGLKFCRQHPSGPYIADFYCHAARMIVEIDGAAHGCGDRLQRDAHRDRWFEDRGLAVMRIRATDVLGDCEAVVHGIAHRAGTRLNDQEE